ncbi:thiol reductant ABC exporter subunit CydC [Paenibacillus sp. JX-17]|uniref:Thiol reductant ABC exporter subunit CydC n=1 Tax=Paenibacillus lacisoli TaxID=3064525 RepID=A0ABT9CCK2_9BACL|nr:thiol reductant ABC exporter subunit CydC [Paenibacillus sp. JX-17]MDO7906384.1 thiol reductant ABC exporter subunit CydC [Paenibacillus sp. JX-17]
MRRKGWIRPYLMQLRGRIAGIALLGVLAAMFAAALMFTSGYLISKSALRPENILMVYVPIVGVRTFGIGRAALRYAERLAGHDTVLQILSRMRVRLYRRLEPHALQLRQRYETGELLGLLAEDVERLQDVFLRTLFPAVTALVIYTAAIAGLGWFDASFALMTGLYLLLLLVGLPWLSLRVTRSQQLKIKQQRSVLYRTLTDAVLGLGDWLISGRTAEFTSRYEAQERETERLERCLNRWLRWRSLLGQLLVGLVMITTLVWAGHQVEDGHMQPTLLAAFVLVILPLMDAFLPVAEAVERLPLYQESFRRLDAVPGGEENDSGTLSEEEEHRFRTAARLRADGAVTIALTNVSSSYMNADSGPQPPLAVAGISLKLLPGSRTAVLGRSGAGKSTLLKLIQGVQVPLQGQVTLNGVDAHQIGDAMPQLIAVLNQNPYLFDTSVANNIRLGRPDATLEDIREAARRARLDALIESLPQGYDTPVQEAGLRFSGGERQRIALARILLQDTPVIILDEPTAGLDPRTERDLLATVLETIGDRTLIWVTHHLAGMEAMDQIVFMEQGRIAMQGPHDWLMERYPRYRSLYRLDCPVPPPPRRLKQA